MPRPALPAFTLACLAALLPAGAAADCTVVFGQGRQVAADDSAGARQWDGVNLSFNSRVAQALGERGEAVVPLVAPVAATDVGATVRAMLARARAEGCSRVVETTLFADVEADMLVARLREYPLEDDGSGALRIGAPRLTVERQFDLSPATLKRVRPAQLGARMAAELLEQRAAATK
ncbi:hypothetical protein CLD22_04915 [Rubrivivax gelatinosus]|nr:hypothetical protein [Rubrivivax gelatinosus]